MTLGLLLQDLRPKVGPPGPKYVGRIDRMQKKVVKKPPDPTEEGMCSLYGSQMGSALQRKDSGTYTLSPMPDKLQVREDQLIRRLTTILHEAWTFGVNRSIQ